MYSLYWPIVWDTMIKQPITANKMKGIHKTFKIICCAFARYENPTNEVLARQSKKVALILWDTEDGFYIK